LTYGLCVVVDDLRHGIDLVIRGEDLLNATPAQVRLGRLLGRETPPRFLHHPLIRRPDGRKLSKADGATSVRELLASGWTPKELRSRAGSAVGVEPIRTG
jgi:glutamyl-tRNA synthetase/glutamyl-Q tRNA(Asp) synthetase